MAQKMANFMLGQGLVTTEEAAGWDGGSVGKFSKVETMCLSLYWE